MGGWVPTDMEVRDFFTDGVHALYEKTHHPELRDADAAFTRWLAKHDRHVMMRQAEKNDDRTAR